MFPQRTRRKQGGFSLVEVLISVAVIGILVGVAMPNLMIAVRRSRQRRTMCDMRTLGAAFEAYAADHNVYPVGSCVTDVPLPSVARLKPGSFASLAPTYIAEPPIRDGWGRLFGFGRDSSGAFYLIQSRAEDGGDFETLRCGTTTDFNDDIAYSNGNFVQWPEGGIPASTLSKLTP
jgi:prepilin-type N-terminal cleavage/methylation domain-containing protein